MATDLLSAATRTESPKCEQPVSNDLVAATVAASAVVGEFAEVASSNPLGNVSDTGNVADAGEAVDTNRAGQGSGAAEPFERTLSKMASDYVQLTKPRIVVMILVTTVATAIMGAGGLVAAGELLWLLAATGAVAASAGAANQIWERVIDRRMTRTASRPMPTGRLRTVPAVVYTAGLGIVGSVLLYQMFGLVPAMSGVATWVLYVLVYTPLKTRSEWNTTVGAVAGALPVLIGYTATGGALTEWTGWLLVGVLVAWQYPHFMAIAWLYRRQYDEAGFQMTTTVDPSGRSAGWQSIAGSIVLIGCSIALCCIPGGVIGSLIATVAVCLAGFPMLRASFRFAADPTDAEARKLMRSSLLVLPAVLLIFTLRVFW